MCELTSLWPLGKCSSVCQYRQPNGQVPSQRLSVELLLPHFALTYAPNVSINAFEKYLSLYKPHQMVTALEHSIWRNLIYVLEPWSLILGSYFLWGENCVFHLSLLQGWETRPFSSMFYSRLVRTSLLWGINTVPYKLGYMGHTGGPLLPHHFQINTR